MSERAESLLAEIEQAVEVRDTGLFGVGSSPEGRSGPLHPEAIETGLIEAGGRRALAERLRADAMVDLVAWMAVARKRKMPIAQIARLAGVTRQTVYDLTRG
jgi:hypothetical protein